MTTYFTSQDQGVANPFVDPQARNATKQAISRCIGEAEFAAIYAAADFASEFEMWMDTMVTISWSLFGITTDEAVQAAFSGFTKCLRDWLDRRTIPVAFIFGHEIGPAVGLHSHLNVFVPGERYRSEFRNWVSEWGERFSGRYVPRAIRVSGPKIETPWLHWLRFGYLMKGCARDCIVQSHRVSPDGRDVRLGDLIPFEWSEPGEVTLTHRVGASRSLGPDRRSVGVPTGFDYLLDEPKVNLANLLAFGATGSDRNIARAKKPFRSRWEDGARDVRTLYGTEFFERVTGLSPVETVTRVDRDIYEYLKLVDID